jgi:signal transduction histidine kinase
MFTSLRRQPLVTQLLLCVTLPVLLAVLIAGLLVLLNSADSRLALTVVLTGLATCALVTLAGLLVIRGMRKSFEEITSLVERVARGEAPAASAETYSSLESRQAVASVLAMTRTLDQQRTDLKANNLGLARNVEARTREVNALVGISERATRASSEDPVALMSDILEELHRAIGYTAASIWTREPDRKVTLRAFKVAGDPALSARVQGARLGSSEARVYALVERKLEPVVVNQSRRNLIAWLFAQLVEGNPEILYRSSRSWMAAPLLVHDAMIGVLRVDENQPDYFTPERERLLTAVARQAALAIEHARLSIQSEQAAVAAERTRIARELHDAVSQSLFAASVTAEMAAKLLDTNPERVREQLSHLQQLNRGAVSEMRMLLFELRPDSLRQAPLSELFKHMADAALTRSGVTVTISMRGESALPVAVKQQMYRIAQEAVNNLMRHSKATEAKLSLSAVSDVACEMTISDNGVGFNPAEGKPGHLGLHTMRERADEIGADFDIESTPGGGTTVRVTWALEDEDTL